MRSSAFVGHVHCRPCYRGYWVCWGGQRCSNNHLRRPPDTETGAFYGTQYGYGPGGPCNGAYYWRRVYYEYILAVVYVTPFPMEISKRLNFLILGFYINLPLGVIVGGFLLFNTVLEPKPKDPPLQILSSVIKSLDLPGFMLICPAVVMFLLGLQFGGNEYAWDSSVVIGLLVGAGANFVVFLIWEWHQGDNAMVPLAMLKNRVIWSAAMTMFFSLSSVLVADFYIAIYFQAIHDDTPLMSGVHMLPITLGIVLFTMVSGTLSKCFQS